MFEKNEGGGLTNVVCVCIFELAVSTPFFLFVSFFLYLLHTHVWLLFIKSVRRLEYHAVAR